MRRSSGFLTLCISVLILTGCSTSGQQVTETDEPQAISAQSLMQQACSAINDGATYEGFVENLLPMWQEADQLAGEAAAQEPGYADLSSAIHDYYMAIFGAQTVNSERFVIFDENSAYLDRDEQFTISDTHSLILKQCPNFS